MTTKRTNTTNREIITLPFSHLFKPEYLERVAKWNSEQSGYDKQNAYYTSREVKWFLGYSGPAYIPYQKDWEKKHGKKSLADKRILSLDFSSISEMKIFNNTALKRMASPCLQFWFEELRTVAVLSTNVYGIHRRILVLQMISSLDPDKGNAQKVISLIKEWAKENDWTFVMSSCDTDLSMYLALKLEVPFWNCISERFNLIATSKDELEYFKKNVLGRNPRGFYNLKM